MVFQKHKNSTGEHGGRSHFPMDAKCLNDVAATWVMNAASCSSAAVGDDDFHTSVCARSY